MLKLVGQGDLLQWSVETAAEHQTQESFGPLHLFQALVKPFTERETPQVPRERGPLQGLIEAIAKGKAHKSTGQSDELQTSIETFSKGQFLKVFW